MGVSKSAKQTQDKEKRRNLPCICAVFGHSFNISSVLFFYNGVLFIFPIFPKDLKNQKEHVIINSYGRISVY